MVAYPVSGKDRNFPCLFQQLALLAPLIDRFLVSLQPGVQALASSPLSPDA